MSEQSAGPLGRSTNPLETPFGPTSECLCAGEVMLYVSRGEASQKVLEHLQICLSCTDWVTRFRERYSRNNKAG